MEQTLGYDVAASILNQHERNGVKVYASEPVVTGNKLQFSSGHSIDVDLVLHSSDFASEPSILGRDIETNPFLQISSDSNVFAVGDDVSFPSLHTGSKLLGNKYVSQ